MALARAVTVDRRDSAGVLSAFRAAVGNTPVVHIGLEIAGRPRRIGLKLEGHNPCGSIKDRTAVSLLESIGPDRLDRATMLVESTSGNLGVSLAHLAGELDLPFHAVVDPKLSPVVAERMRDRGAVLHTVRVPDRTGGYLLSRLDAVARLHRDTPGAVWPNQYANPANPAAHRDGTGPEILRQTDGRVDAVFVAVSTGGTIAGISAFLRTARPATRVIGVDAVGSVVFEDRPGARRLSGIGASRRSDFVHDDTTDGYVMVDDESAFAFCRALEGWSGLRVGGSSGAVLAGCVRYLAEHPEITRPVCVAPDVGENYLRTVFDDDYLRREGIVLHDDLLRPAPAHPPVRYLGTD
jgi:cysteine synthase A